MNRICVVTGHFGSGKTEFALNLAIKQKRNYNKVIILDMDIVNPYFRTKDAQKTLESLGIGLIAPRYANTNIDLPSIPPEILSVFEDKEAFVVFDAGGDEDGAMVLGRFKGYFDQNPHDMLMVINTKRPLTQDEEGILAMKEQIEIASRLKVTGFVNNTNLMGESTPEMLLNGQEIIENAAEKCRLKVWYISAREDVLNKLAPSVNSEKFELDLMLNAPWQNEKRR